jgi:inorganic pyrophosphatase/exopolyphosphatase
VKAKRFDQSGLGTADLLRKDYKQWLMGPGVNVGISSVGLPLRKIASKDKSFKSEVKAFAGRHRFTFLAS